MLINTHYPQVPISTSNVATDLALIDNQQTPARLPPQEPSKSHEERAFNPKYERAPADLIKDKQQQQQAAQNQEKNLPAPPQAAKAVFFAPQQKAALQRKDLHLRQGEKQASTQPQGLASHPALRGQSQDFYQALGQHVDQFYHTQALPKPATQVSMSV